MIISSNSALNPSTRVERVVSLNSLGADIVFRLDETKLVGRPGTQLLEGDCKISQVTSVSQGQMLPELEKITSLNPDLVICSAGFHSGIAKKLEQQGIHALLTHTDNWSDLISLTETLAGFIEANPAQLLSEYQNIVGSKFVNTPRTLVLVAKEPILAPNKDSWASDILYQLGINSLTHEFESSSPRKGFASLSSEQIKAENPEALIVISTEREPLIEYYNSQPFWNELEAVQNSRVFLFDYYGLIIPGSIKAIEETVNKLKLIYSELE